MIAIPVIASEAIHRAVSGKVDCFVALLLAMTAYSNTLALNAASGTKHSSYFPKIR